MNKYKIAIASDHAGFDLKERLIKYLNQNKIQTKNFGTSSKESSDYPDFAHPLSKAIENKEYNFGILICGTGNGVNMVANKYQNIQSALCWNTKIAKLARAHNNANICALPARFITFKQAKEIINTFLTTNFEGGRHQSRIEKIPLK